MNRLKKLFGAARGRRSAGEPAALDAPLLLQIAVTVEKPWYERAVRLAVYNDLDADSMAITLPDGRVVNLTLKVEHPAASGLAEAVRQELLREKRSPLEVDVTVEVPA